MSSSISRSATRWLLLLTGLVIAGASIAYFMLQSSVSGPPRTATGMAAMLPADTPLLAWTTDIAGLLELARDAGVDGVVLAEKHPGFGAVVQKLGANPLTTAGLATLGVDTSGSVGLALTPAPQTGMVCALYLPLAAGQSAAAMAKNVIAKLELSDRLGVSAAGTNGGSLAWLYQVRNGERGKDVAALLDVEGGGLLLFPAGERKAGENDVATGIAEYAGRLAAGGVPTLDSATAFEEAVANSGGALLAAFINPGDATRSLELGDDSMQLLFWVMASAKGAGFTLRDDGSALWLRSTSVLSSADVAAGKPRDLTVLDIVPGHPLAGIHLAIDLRKALAELERTLPEALLKTHPLVQVLTSNGQIPGISEDLSLMDLLNGELGLFLGHIGDSPEATLDSIVGFVGAGEHLSEELMVQILEAAPWARKVERQEVGGLTIHRLTSFAGAPGFLWKGNRVWFAGNQDALVAIAQGAAGNLTSGDRNGLIAGVMRNEGPLALYADLDRTIAGLLPLFGQSLEGLGTAGRFLATLDYFTLAAHVDGALVHSELALHAKGESFRGSALPALLATLDGTMGQVRERKSEKATANMSARAESARGEAQHYLHKIYSGAANYFESPSYGPTGEALPCQFPASQEATPAPDCCADGSGRCSGQRENWTSSATWNALHISFDSPHYCVYSFESGGTGPAARFTATARCDPDCDGKATVYRMTGKPDSSSGDRFCQMSGERTSSETEE